MIGGRSALLAASGDVGPYGNWTGNYSDVSLLLRGNGPSIAGTTLVDESPTPKAMTVIGGAQMSNTQSKFGGSSLFANAGYWTTPRTSAFEFGTGDFTLEMWVCPTASSSGTFRAVASNYSSFTSGQWALFSSTNLSLTKWQFINNGVYPGDLNSTSDVVNNVWTFIAVVRSGNTLTMYVNGIAEATKNVSGATFNGNGPSVWIGTAGDSPSSTLFAGYIDDLRITKGIGRYVQGTGANAGKMVFAGTNDFALPTAQFPTNVTDDPSYNSVSLLLRNGASILTPIDESPTPKTITISGDAQISTTTFKYGGSALVAGTSPNFTWGSNRIQVTAGSAFAYGTADFTVEAWIYPTGASDGLFWGQTVSGTNYFICQISASGVPSFTFATSGSGTNVTGPAITLNQWSHVAIVRSAGQVKVYSNGVGGTAVACAQDFSDTTFIPTIGSYTHNAGSLVFSGLIDDLRVTKGISRYKKDFLPPPAQLPAI